MTFDRPSCGGCRQMREISSIGNITEGGGQ